MDVRMPGTDGIEATRRIVRASPSSRVLILTTFDLDEYAFAGLTAGASGFLLKNTRPEELLTTIRSVAAGDAVVSPRITRLLLESVRPHLPTGTDAPRDSRLIRPSCYHAGIRPTARFILIAKVRKPSWWLIRLPPTVSSGISGARDRFAAPDKFGIATLNRYSSEIS